MRTPFDGSRLRQARQVSSLTKDELARKAGVSPAAVSQYEASLIAPSSAVLDRLAESLRFPADFFSAGRPKYVVQPGEVFFRSLKRTSSLERARSVAHTEMLWELVAAIENYVRLPVLALDLPSRELEGLEGRERAEVGAQLMRLYFKLGDRPVPHLVRTIENLGIAVSMVPDDASDPAPIDAYSLHTPTRPMMVLSPRCSDDVLRHRFSVAHEFGHLVLHRGHTENDNQQEREADMFAAEFLTPARIMRGLLPRRLDMSALAHLSYQWGVSIKSLIYRSQELGLISESTARRGYIRLNQLTAQGHIAATPITQYPGEVPSLLRVAVEQYGDLRGMTVVRLAEDLRWPPRLVRQMLGYEDDRPSLTLV